MFLSLALSAVAALLNTSQFAARDVDQLLLRAFTTAVRELDTHTTDRTLLIRRGADYAAGREKLAAVMGVAVPSAPLTERVLGVDKHSEVESIHCDRRGPDYPRGCSLVNTDVFLRVSSVQTKPAGSTMVIGVEVATRTGGATIGMNSYVILLEYRNSGNGWEAVGAPRYMVP